MSRIGKKPVEFDSEVKVSLADNVVSVSGPKGSLSEKIRSDVEVKIEDNLIKVIPANDEQQTKAYWGLFRSLIANMVQGVKHGYSKSLEINGTGYRASVSGNFLILSLGYSHDIFIEIEDGLSVDVKKNVITISGASKHKVGQLASNIRSLRKPEPYKGKGVKYSDETIRRKAGKKK